ncbi:hypothetical protein N444_06770 [Escherichia coli O6:H16:CFA/II str. B2C]|nr:hypothetical protein N444_06770 [Escherichia coli O6:H16:CFA/II str. B2C]OMI56989.1 hypothetical protein Q676_08100 [Escherichia coli N40607]
MLWLHVVNEMFLNAGVIATLSLEGFLQGK